MRNILIKTWVWSFYQTYSGLFFVLLLIFFGMFRGDDHLVIAQFLVGEFLNLFYFIILIILYSFLTGIFSVKFLKNKKHSFIKELIQLSYTKRLFLLLTSFILLFLPVLLYTTFLVIVATFEGMIFHGLTVTIVTVSFIFFFTLIYHNQIIHPSEKTFGNRQLVYIPNLLKYTLFYIVFKHLFLSRTFSVFLTKALSFLLLVIFSIIISTIDYYHRFLAIVIFITMVSNVFISYEIHYFINYKMGFIRNLPQPIWKIWLNILMVIIIFVLPEIVYIFRNYNEYVSVFSLIIFLLNGVSFLMFCFVYLLKTRLDQKKFIMRFYFGFLIFIILILFDTPVILLSIVFLISSFILFNLYFYKYENVFIN